MSIPRWVPSPEKEGTYWLLIFEDGHWSVGRIDKYATWSDNTFRDYTNSTQVQYTIVGGWIPLSGRLMPKVISTQYISQLPQEMQHEVMDSLR